MKIDLSERILDVDDLYDPPFHHVVVVVGVGVGVVESLFLETHNIRRATSLSME